MARPRWASGRAAAGLGAGFGHALLAVLLTWPLALHPHRIPLGTERARTVPLFNVWTLAWTADRLDDGLRGWWDAPIFWPNRGSFALSEPQLPTGVLFAGLRAVAGDPFVAYNLVLLALLTANGIAMGALARALGAERRVAFTAGALAQALPYSAHELGVLQLLAQAPLVATLAALIAWRDAPRLRTAAAVGAFAALTALSCGYYGILLTIPIGMAAVLWWGPRRPAGRDVLAGALVAGGIVVGAALPVLLMQARRTAGFSWSRTTVAALSATPAQFAPAGPWWPGWLVVPLALAGLWCGRRRPAVRWLAVTATLAAAASFGPRLSLFGWRPWWSAVALLPGLDRLRNPTRFVALFQLALVALTTPALRALVDRVERWAAGAGRSAHPRRATGAFLAAVTLCAVLAFPTDRRSAPTPALPSDAARFLATTADREPVVALPFAASGRVADFEATTVAMLDGLHHRHPLLNGYSGFFPDGERALRRQLQGFPDAASLAALRDRDVRWAVVDNAWFAAGPAAGVAADGRITVVFRGERSSVLRLAD